MSVLQYIMSKNQSKYEEKIIFLLYKLLLPISETSQLWLSESSAVRLKIRLL